MKQFRHLEVARYFLDLAYTGAKSDNDEESMIRIS